MSVSQSPNNNDDREEQHRVGFTAYLRDRPWGVIGFVALCISFFLPWLATSLFWPSQDAERLRTAVTLVDGRSLVVDHPMRFLADDQSFPIHLTAATDRPMSAMIELPSGLPLVLTSAVPSSAVQVSDATKGYLVVTWPITADVSVNPASPNSATSAASVSPSPTSVGTGLQGTPAASPNPTPSSPASIPNANSTPAQSPGRQGTAVASQTPLVRTIIPAITQSSTVTLFFRNASSERGLPFINGFKSGAITIADGTETIGRIYVEIETTDRASWRLFIEKYTFIAILPFIIPVLGYLISRYINRLNILRRNTANDLLLLYKEALHNGDSVIADRKFRNLDKYSHYLSEMDKERIGKIDELRRNKISTNIELYDFATWSEVWLDALIMASKIQLSSPSGEEQTLRDCVRVFPADNLPVFASTKYEEFIESLDLIPKQHHSWPLSPKPPDNYSDMIKKPLLISNMNIFPSNASDSTIDHRYLFSDNTNWFWREHPIYQEITVADRSTLILGARGSGRTALALALTKYANRREKHVLGSFHARFTTLVDVQEMLAHELLRFVRLRPTWLIRLEQGNRDLLANLLLTHLNIRYVLAELNAPRRQTSAKYANFEQSDIGFEDAPLELRLLSHSVAKVAAEHSIPLNQWFLGLARCVERLGFDCVRIALDMSTTDWADWHNEHFANFLQVSQGDYPVPIQFVFLIADDAGPLNFETPTIDKRELRWQPRLNTGDDPLESMLRHRVRQRGIDEVLWPAHLPGLHNLSVAARGNPRRLANLWKAIEAKWPTQEKLTDEMVTEVEREVQ